MTRPVGAASDESGSMAIVMLITIIGLMLSAVLLPILITQDRTTRFTSTRVEALGAAEAGIDVAAGRIRAGITVGLPCTDTVPITGNVDTPILGGTPPVLTGPQPDVATYTVTIEYFSFNPVREPVPSLNTLPCSLTAAPNYARVTSMGVVKAADGSTAGNSATAGRKLSTTYAFVTSNTNVPGGGVIKLSPLALSPKSLCLDAGVGKITAVIPCSPTTPLASQVFAYRNDLTLQLKSPLTSTADPGLCLNATTPPDPAVHPVISGNAVVLSACSPTGITPEFSQQWSLNKNGEFEASLPSSQTDGVLSSLCMTVASASENIAVVLAACSPPPGSTADPKQMWVPDQSVGVGAAVAPQWANYSEFSRCLAVPPLGVASTHLIDYPCTQSPWAGTTAWNLKFSATAIPTGSTSVVSPIYMTPNGVSPYYCLTSPVTAGSVSVASNGAGTPCGVAQSAQRWTIYGGDKSLSASDRYTIKDSNSRCLDLGTPVAPDTTYKSVVVTACSGAASQKWNANPNLSTVTLQNTGEGS